MVKTILIISLGLSGCFLKDDNKSKKSMAEKLDELREKHSLYISLVKNNRLENGWIFHGCDGLLFNSLLSAGGVDIDINLAEDRGKWYRTPEHTCLAEARSRSTISRDMILGWLFHIWQHNDRAALDRFITYGKANRWEIGEHDGTLDGQNRVTMTPTFQATIFELAYRMGVEDNGQRSIPQIWTPTTGFASHLQVLTILLRGLLIGGIDDIMLNTLRANSERNPNNALFSATLNKFSNGDQADAINLLLEEKYFPKDRLPDNSNYCTDYLYQREQIKDNQPNKDWLPCRSNSEDTSPKTATELIFTSALILDELRE